MQATGNTKMASNRNAAWVSVIKQREEVAKERRRRWTRLGQDAEKRRRRWRKNKRMDCEKRSGGAAGENEDADKRRRRWRKKRRGW